MAWRWVAMDGVAIAAVVVLLLLFCVFCADIIVGVICKLQQLLRSNVNK